MQSKLTNHSPEPTPMGALGESRTPVAHFAFCSGWILIVRRQSAMNTRIIQLVLIIAFGFQVAAYAADITWPDREEGLAWPKPRSAGKILDDRFASASTNALSPQSGQP